MHRRIACGLSLFRRGVEFRAPLPPPLSPSPRSFSEHVLHPSRASLVVYFGFVRGSSCPFVRYSAPGGGRKLSGALARRRRRPVSRLRNSLARGECALVSPSLSIYIHIRVLRLPLSPNIILEACAYSSDRPNETSGVAADRPRIFSTVVCVRLPFVLATLFLGMCFLPNTARSPHDIEVVPFLFHHRY